MTPREIVAYFIILILFAGVTAVYLRVTRRRRAYQKAHRNYEASRRIRALNPKGATASKHSRSE